ncbi:MAG: Mobile element protein [uncultured Rubrobacteraceae bacterium]|uniref:Mutator family transposase n=1 Tax=uncultured Rubrobacteraceae bacterium TaxID=349277 RepID=A0A6J4QWE3_9ACTN|nr:MAG: Mobile element protein [uncultured Rubrobacteraceae bacterium]
MATDHRRADAKSVQGAFLLDDPGFLKEIVQRVVQEMLEAEMTEHIGAAPYERTDARKGQRNGHKPRALRTRVGTLNLLVPQDREGNFSTRLFSRYQRNEKALCLALMEMYVEGVSTRRVKDITEELCGTSFSKSLVSSLAGSLDAELKAWRERRLEAEAYPYLFVDARYEKARVDGRVVSQGVLIVSGVRDDGLREILAVEVADTESAATYHELFRSLKTRGLKGVELVVSDDHEGLKAAIGRHFQGASWQRCQVHYQRNLLGMVGAKKRKELAADLRAIFAQASREQALGTASAVIRRWREKGHEKVACHIEENIEECLSCLSFPESHRRRIRTTNGQERLNQEIKRRTRVVRIFPNPQACLRLVSALAVEQSEEWVTGRRYLDIEELREHRRSQDCEAEGVMLVKR